MSLSIAFEGPEGAGKTTQIRILSTILREHFEIPVLVAREPGGTSAGDDIRDIILNKEYSSKLRPETYVLLYSASRNEFVHRISEWSKENPEGIVLTDRCWWSTFALQSVDGASNEYIRKVSEPFMKVWPDKVVLLCLPPEESIVRVETERRMDNKIRENNWRDGQELQIFKSIWQKYLDLACEYKDRTYLADSFLGPENIAYRIASEVIGVEKRPYIEVANIYSAAREVSLQQDFTKLLFEEINVRRDLGISSKESLHHHLKVTLIDRGLITPNSDRERV